MYLPSQHKRLSARPIICEPTPLFRLASLLQDSMGVEDDLLLADDLKGPTLTTNNNRRSVSPSPDNSNPRPGTNTPQYQYRHSASRPLGVSYSHWIRQQRQMDFFEDHGQLPRQSTVNALTPLALGAARTTSLSLEHLPATQGAYGAKSEKRHRLDDGELTLEQAKARGLVEFEWNGIDPVPFIADGRVFMVLAGRPDDPKFLQAAHAAFDLLEKKSNQASFTKEDREHNRGDYPAVNVGVTHGMGTLHPLNLDNKGHTKMVEELLADRNVCRLATFASSAFALWAPRTYAYYKQNLDKLFTQMPLLRRIFKKSIFPAATFNFGPKVCTRKHRDCKNCPFGWCSIQSLGQFDPKKGGHLIVWDLGLLIQFPPGSCILIPSAVLSHSNVSIASDEKRASFTQYASGGLFRFVDYGFRTEKQFKREAPMEFAAIRQQRPGKWEEGLHLWSTLEELEQRKAF